MAKIKGVEARVTVVRVRVTPQTSPQKQTANLAEIEAIIPRQSPVMGTHLQKVNKL